MGLEVLREGHAWMLRTLFAPRGYYRRVRTLLHEFPSPAVRRRLSLADFKALGRATLRFGIAGPERWEYWKLLAWTLWHKPRLLAMAVRLAAIGHHQRRTSEQVCAALARTKAAAAASALVPDAARASRLAKAC